MVNFIQEFEKQQVDQINEARGEKFVPDFKVGDSVRVKYKITEGTTTRLQAFVGIVIARSKSFSHYSATFTVRKISDGIGVERKFALYSPLVAGVELVKQGMVRRAKLYYIRNLTGKASRIKEKLDFLTDDKSEASSS